ncbi:hypothetical protein [Allorhizobium taibaishanense]|uniref:Uncharacterized protein n=1 Tax=Allorhizobium taibaishanense TaxID=887144 RepID=A0A1Q9AC37_9HYPH|nr:hypothetical protein [Allorhizobium taibaishanense]MBB4010673.1 hypothetical protein [Allorhizobium taibaishanense]OLP52416.1 hypothetical protein BJF91_15285 [Allorhizobium taibaishanense]
MTPEYTADDADWRLVVRGVKVRGTPEGRTLVKKAILQASGIPLRVREARRRLLILTTSASRGRPTMIEGECGLICMIALDDLVDIVVERGPTLAQVMDAAALGPRMSIGAES